MNKRGSILINVLIITSVLMIIGLMALRVVAADMKFARSDHDRAVALQIAEGGLDHGIELILQAQEDDIVTGTHVVAENITIEIQDKGNNRYLIVSTGVHRNSSRTVNLLVYHRPIFGHSLYVGSADAPLELKNVYFEGPVQICSKEVIFGPNVTFQAGVHFEHSDVVITGSSTPPFALGFGAEVTYGPTEVVPSLHIELLADVGQNHEPGINDINSTYVDFNNLKVYNYYDVPTLQVDWGGTVTAPPGEERLVVIINTGNVAFIGNSSIPETLGVRLIIISGGDIYGVTSAEQLQSIHVPLYLFAQGSIKINNGMKNIRSVVALGSFLLGSGNEEWEFHRFNPIVIPGLEDAWGTFMTIGKWSN